MPTPENTNSVITLAPVPPKPATGISDYYERNKELIIADLKTMSQAALLKHWGMSSKTLWRLKKEWGLSAKRHATQTEPKVKTRDSISGNICATCKHAYEHDEQRWCSKKACPSRIPATMRPAFRPLPDRFQSQPERHESPSDTKVSKGDQGKPSGLISEPAVKVVHIFQVPGGFPPFEKCCNDAQTIWLEVYRDLALHSTTLTVESKEKEEIECR